MDPTSDFLRLREQCYSVVCVSQSVTVHTRVYVWQVGLVYSSLRVCALVWELYLFGIWRTGLGVVLIWELVLWLGRSDTWSGSRVGGRCGYGLGRVQRAVLGLQLGELSSQGVDLGL